MTGIADPSIIAAVLDRPERTLISAADRRVFVNQRVLVTGAGGSIGSELARRIAKCGPASLTLVDSCELNLFAVEHELREIAPAVRIDARLLDVARGRAVDAAFRGARPHVVYHAAAYKHVGMLERDVCAAIRTNVLGTVQVVQAARAVGSRFVLVSSDKSSAPASVMGASKRLAELVTLAAATELFRPVAVRFGNVIGSSGSLVAVAADRIKRGLPIEVTDPEAERYFMSAGEAVSLVIAADGLGRAGEIYWLDMGMPIKVGTVVERLLQWGEIAGHGRVPIRYIGLRPGEKLREDIGGHGLRLLPTRHQQIFVARQPRIDQTTLIEVIRGLRTNVLENDAVGALAHLCVAVPEYEPSATARTAAVRTAIESSLSGAVAAVNAA